MPKVNESVSQLAGKIAARCPKCKGSEIEIIIDASGSLFFECAGVHCYKRQRVRKIEDCAQFFSAEATIAELRGALEQIASGKVGKLTKQNIALAALAERGGK